MDARNKPINLTEAATSSASAASVLSSPATTPAAPSPCLSNNPTTLFALLPYDVTRHIIAPMLTANSNDPAKPAFKQDILPYFMAGMSGPEGSEIRNHFDYLDAPEKILLQAIINDNREMVTFMLDNHPSLLLHQRTDDIIIQSPYTWQIFKIHPTENPLAVAAKLKQIEMIKLLLPYYDQLAQDSRLDEESRQQAIEAREAGLKAWVFYALRKNDQNEDEIVIPSEYTSLINSLINTFINEKLAAGRTDFTHLSDNAENAMRSLLNLLVPKIAVELDNHIDVELLLLAAYQLYDQRFNHFSSWEQRDAFCIRVIGLIQSALPPETAKIFCEGLYYVVNQNRPVGPRAAALKLSGDEPFYRVDRGSLSGLGGKYVVGDGGLAHCLLSRRGAFKTYVEQKHQAFVTYAAIPATVTAPAARP